MMKWLAKMPCDPCSMVEGIFKGVHESTLRSAALFAGKLLINALARQVVPGCDSTSRLLCSLEGIEPAICQKNER